MHISYINKDKMRRKIIEQGYNTLTVSLPKKWCDKQSLENGDEVEVGEKGNCLIISKESFRGAGNVNLDVTGLNSSTINLLINSLYSYGYDSITINTRDEKANRWIADKELNIPSIINYATNLLIGAELMSSSKTSYKIEVVTEDSQAKFNTILRRVFLLINDMFETLNEGVIKKDKNLMESIPAKYVNTERFINYSLRLLNKFGHEDAEKTTFYFAIITFLTKIIKIIKNYTGYVETEAVFVINKRIPTTLNKKCYWFIAELCEMFKIYSEIFYKYDIQKIAEIHKKRDLFKRKLYAEYNGLAKEDVFVIVSLMPVADIMLDLIELRMAIGYK